MSECGFARKSMPRKGNDCEESSDGGEEVSCLMSPVPSECALFRSKLSFGKTLVNGREGHFWLESRSSSTL